MVSPACDARIVQVLAARSVTVVPVTVHAAGVSDEKVTDNPDEAVALIVNGGVPSVRLLNGANVIDWAAFAIAIAKACVADGSTPLIAVTTPLKFPTALGVPLITPVLAPSARPVGRVPLETA